MKSAEDLLSRTYSITLTLYPPLKVTVTFCFEWTVMLSTIPPHRFSSNSIAVSFICQSRSMKWPMILSAAFAVPGIVQVYAAAGAADRCRALHGIVGADRLHGNILRGMGHQDQHHRHDQHQRDAAQYGEAADILHATLLLKCLVLLSRHGAARLAGVVGGPLPCNVCGSRSRPAVWHGSLRIGRPAGYGTLAVCRSLRA